MIVHTRYGHTETKTGEILDLSRLSRPPKRTRYNRPVRRYYPRSRPQPLVDLVICACGILVSGTALLLSSL